MNIKFLVGIILPVIIASIFFSFGTTLAVEAPKPASDSAGLAQGSVVTPTPDAVVTAEPTTGVVRTQNPVPPVLGTPIQTIVASPTPNITLAPQNTLTPSPTLFEEATLRDGNSGVLYEGIVSVIIFLAGMVGFGLYKNQMKKGQDKCRGIKDLLEQKIKELEDMLRNMPKDKAKELIHGAVLDQLKKDEDIKIVLEKAGVVKKKYDDLKKVIELLQKQYNLCTLELPAGESLQYKGTIVKNSLRDVDVLKSLKVEREYSDEDWNLNDVMVGEKQIEKLGDYLNDGPWYMNFWKEGDDEMIIVFKEKSFKIKRSDSATWKDALEYGKLKGISEEQLDFL